MYIRIVFCGSLQAPAGEMAEALKNTLRTRLEAPTAEIDLVYDPSPTDKANPRISADSEGAASRTAWETVAGWYPSAIHRRPHDALLTAEDALHDAIGAVLSEAGLMAKKRPSMWPIPCGFGSDRGLIEWPPADMPGAHTPRGYW